MRFKLTRQFISCLLKIDPVLELQFHTFGTKVSAHETNIGTTSRTRP